MSTKQSPAYASMQERQQKYLKPICRNVCRAFPECAALDLKRSVWKLIKNLFRVPINSKRTILGLNARDWQNCFAADTSA